MTKIRNTSLMPARLVANLPIMQQTGLLAKILTINFCMVIDDFIGLLERETRLHLCRFYPDSVTSASSVLTYHEEIKAGEFPSYLDGYVQGESISRLHRVIRCKDLRLNEVTATR